METTTVGPARTELVTQGFRVARDEDRFGERHNSGGILSFKVLPEDSRGALLAVELVHHAQGGPPRHLHHAEDEWFYVLEGEYLLEVGDERFHLGWVIRPLGPAASLTPGHTSVTSRDGSRSRSRLPVSSKHSYAG